jgi:hypothetical protein
MGQGNSLPDPERVLKKLQSHIGRFDFLASKLANYKDSLIMLLYCRCLK